MIRFENAIDLSEIIFLIQFPHKATKTTHSVHNCGHLERKKFFLFQNYILPTPNKITIFLGDRTPSTN